MDRLELTAVNRYGKVIKSGCAISTICQEIAKMRHEATIKMTYSMQPAQALALKLDEELKDTSLVDFERYYDEVTDFSEISFNEGLLKLGCLDEESPSTINIYTATFENKDLITEAIKEYNAAVEKEQQIAYTDYMGLLMSGITTIIDAVSLLIYFNIAASILSI